MSVIYEMPNSEISPQTQTAMHECEIALLRKRMLELEEAVANGLTIRTLTRMERNDNFLSHERREFGKHIDQIELQMREVLAKRKSANFRYFNTEILEPTVIEQMNPRLEKDLTRLLAKHFQKRKKEVKRVAKDIAKNYLQFPERVAAIVGKTYSVMGDDCKVADDEALGRIRDLLEELDPDIISRNKKKRLS